MQQGFVTNETAPWLEKKWREQSYCTEVLQGNIFTEQKMKFGLVVGRLAVLEKGLGTDYE